MYQGEGKLVIIGGAEDKKYDKEILEQVVELVRGKLVIITTATKEPEEVGKEYKKLFYDLGLKEVEILNITSRKEAEDTTKIKKLKKAAGIFFTGGDQLRITSLLGGSQACQVIREAYRKGKIIIGTSAGAAVMSEIMIVVGQGDQSPKKSSLRLAFGLGLVEDIIIDQHFSQRGRLGRLLSALAQNPALLGIGIDEDTAVIVNKEQCKVIGSGTVTIVDCTNVVNTNISDLKPDEPLTLTNIKLHVLAKGYRFNLRTKEIDPPE